MNQNLTKLIEYIEKATPLHDIGKVNIPDEILLKPESLNIKEFEIMKKHTVIGAELLLEIQEKYSDNRFLDLGESIIHIYF